MLEERAKERLEHRFELALRPREFVTFPQRPDPQLECLVTYEFCRSSSPGRNGQNEMN